jgi:F-type H+/Na+-transporting ATPase subunit alpha
MKPDPMLEGILKDTHEVFNQFMSASRTEPLIEEIGTVTYVGNGIARVSGLPGVQSEEMVRFSGGGMGMAMNLDEHEVGVILLDESHSPDAGDQVKRTGRVLDVPVGPSLLGRIVDGVGRPQDGKGAIGAHDRWPIEREAPAIMDRAPVTVPLQTGIKVIDALIPIGRGQRELILGDRQTGKTTVAIDTIINQRNRNVICIYCAIGQRSSSVAKRVADLKEHGAMDYTVVILAEGEATPGLQFITPYAATTIGEAFMEEGKDVLVVYDDLTRHARAYRELSLLLRRPPGREAFPGDIFYLHSRLLERSTRLHSRLGGGSLTALPIVETEAQNVAAYIPTNIISITDGQIYLSPNLFQKGILPAVDVGKSVSRVGGKTQLAAYKSVAGDLRLSYSQFEELEMFSRFSTRLDDTTKRILNRGACVREVLKQAQYSPVPESEQIVSLLAVATGLFDGLALEQIHAAEIAAQERVQHALPHIAKEIIEGETLTDDDRTELLHTVQEAISKFTPMSH